MEYVIGIDLGTSAVKTILVNQQGVVVEEVSKAYPLIQTEAGYSEQDPESWVSQTIASLSELVDTFNGDVSEIKGISFSGQMHGLVLLNDKNQVLRKAILWNDTRTTAECHEIHDVIGRDKLLDITKNIALEGFTLPKLLWVKNNEPEIFSQVDSFLLPKDYVRYRLTGKRQIDYSDAAGTLMLDLNQSVWSEEICKALEIPLKICPELVDSTTYCGDLKADIAVNTGLTTQTKVFAGGADNACGAIGAGILSEGRTMCSVGTSGVVLSYDGSQPKNYQGQLHCFNHGVADAFYAMGVTLSAGYSLNWAKAHFFEETSFEEMMTEAEKIPIGAAGVLFTPYLLGERTPHADAQIRASFIGLDGAHTNAHLVRAVIEGITFSLKESIEIFREKGQKIDTVLSIGGGAKSDFWLQMQADIFNTTIVKLKSEQGPGLGAAMIAAVGAQWFPTLKTCSEAFLNIAKTFEPQEDHVEIYQKLFAIYQKVYDQTKSLNDALSQFR